MRSVLLVLFFVGSLAQAAALQPPPVIGRSWIIGDLSSDQILASQKPDERIEPASLTKLMTAYLVFAALREKRISPEQQVTVSVRAWRAPGSRMFVEPRRPVAVDELIRGMVVQSGNDACIALAETTAGSEEVFAQMMNREAARLGMKNTRFMNSTGLPDAQHYSTAQDLYLLAAALIRDFPAEYGQYYSQKEFRYNIITQPNRNRLLWLDPTVDGVKTGHTEAAGFCLIASSRRGGRRLLSVLLGSTSEATRAQESQKLLNWGFQFFDSVKLYAGGDAVKSLEVWKGAESAVKAGFKGDLMITVPKGEAGKLKAELLSQQPLVAPVARGQRVGTLRVTHDGRPVGDYQGVYFQVTRGVAKRDHAFPKNAEPTVFMMSNPLVNPSMEQVEKGASAVSAPDNRWLRCDIKSISLVGNVLLRQLSAEADGAETILFRDGKLTEASASNVFIVRRGVIESPPKGNLILPGITYDVIAELARANGMPLEFREVREPEVRGADELWVTSSSKEVLAIVMLDGKRIGDGQPGPVFRRMYQLYQEFKLKVMRAGKREAASV